MHKLFENILNFFATWWRNRPSIADSTFDGKDRLTKRKKLRQSVKPVNVQPKGNFWSCSLETLSPVSHSLGRLFAACLGSIALSATIILGLMSGETPESILVQSLIATVVYATIGLGIGQVADSVVRQSVEINYRNKFEKLREGRKNTPWSVHYQSPSTVLRN